jgi:hypothetical protein
MFEAILSPAEKLNCNSATDFDDRKNPLIAMAWEKVQSVLRLYAYGHTNSHPIGENFPNLVTLFTSDELVSSHGALNKSITEEKQVCIL